MTESAHSTLTEPTVDEQLCWLMAKDTNPKALPAHVARVLCLLNWRERAQLKRQLRAVLDAVPG